MRIGAIITVTLLSLVVLGYMGARLGGAQPMKPIARVVIGGALAMAVTMLVGKLFGAAVS
jgi:VIT1/CCC1 family predicted Fe2+/Mn2+ transporter